MDTSTQKAGAPQARAPARPAGGEVSRPAASAASAALGQLRQRIRAAFSSCDERALHEQKKTVEFGTTIAFLAPAAVLLLSVQTLAFSGYRTRPIAIALIAAELAALLVVLFVLLDNLGPRSHRWATHRLQAEVLRREEFLLIARVGPYLTGRLGPELESEVERRIELIRNEDSNPAELLGLHDPEGAYWRDALEDAEPETSALPETGFLDEYLAGRVEQQRTWYAGRSSHLARDDERYETIAKGVLVACLLLATAHLVTIIIWPSGNPMPLNPLIEISAIVLPPIGAAVAALQSFFQSRRLSRSYEHYSLILGDLTRALHGLQTEWSRPGLPPAAASRLLLEFKRIALRVEELLAVDLRQWYFVMRPDKPQIQ